MAVPAELAHLAPALPEDRVGAVLSIAPLSMGLSGAGVYAVSTTRGERVLRVQSERADPAGWTQQLRILRLAAERGIAPALLHVDEAARAVVAERVAGAPLALALADPAQRLPAIASVVDQLIALHELDPTGIADADPLVHGRAQYAAQRTRPGFPAWASALEPIFDAIEATLSHDPRRVVSHNDLNPGNVLWDGARAWLVDWEVAGLGHPFYDLAVLAMFLQLEDAAAHQLLALQERRTIEDGERVTFAALRRMAALLVGLTFLGLVPDLAALPPSAPTLSEVYGGLRAGTLDLQQPSGTGAFGLALLQVGVGPAGQGERE